jgi:hypothetical protein
MLSWFVLPHADKGGDLIAGSLAAVLADDAHLGMSPELPGMMARVVDACADSVRAAVPDRPPELALPRERPRVMLVDQPGSRKDAAAFRRMVSAAVAEHPAAEFYIWPVPYA